MPLADQPGEVVFTRFVQGRDAQLEQFVMIERQVDFLVQVIGESFLTYGDDRF